MVTTRRIGINAHLLSAASGYRRAGIHHYITQVLNHLPRDSAGFEYLIFSNGPTELQMERQAQRLSSRWPTHRRLARIVWEQSAWPLAAARLDLDLLHSTAFVTPLLSPAPTVVTVYDLSFVHYPDRFPVLQRLYLSSQTRRSCRQARRVVTISESGRRDVHTHLGVPLAQIDVVTPGVGPQFRPRLAAEVKAFRERLGLPERFILHVGTLQPRKNIHHVIDAFARLGRPELALVLVGGEGWAYDEIYARVEALDLGRRVHFAGYVSDAELPLWYNAATLLAFSSAYEGFGMPIAQAMACGTPVVAAATSAVPEVTGDAALHYAAGDVGALAEQMATVLDDAAVAAKMQAQGRQQARRFSWTRAGEAMQAVYRRALEAE
ncbi:MAG: glycosyltransferase family 1 protein [Candidatus Promineifilaceae bacterium]|nr:glycosyltransferase family 1 protein [Candidatus Promineifilaceae bacterium]